MAEFINAYELDDKFRPKQVNRKEFYDEQINIFKNEGKPTKAVGAFGVLLITENGEIILQKRASHKRHNPYLIDKSVGGHIQFGDTVYYTAMLECVEELRVPAVVLKEDEDFHRTLTSLSHSLESVAVLELIDHNIYSIVHIFDKEPIQIAKNLWFFIGVYGGPIKPVDGEASGILYYKWDDLMEEMDMNPNIFTQDLHFIVKKYSNRIKKLIHHLTSE